jgi:hypothetical protein
MSVFFFATLIELFSIPILILWPIYLADFDKKLWTLDSFWLISIFLKFVTARTDLDSYETTDIMFAYVSSECLLDVLATLPTMVSKHNRVLLVFRLFHVYQINKTDYLTSSIVAYVYPSSLIKQDTLMSLIGFILRVFLAANYFVCLWIFVGDKSLLGESDLPWL